MAKAGEEHNTQCPTGGEGTDSHIKKLSISKWELPKQKEARGISVHEKLKTMDEAVPPVASKKGKRGRPSSGLSEQDREKKHNEVCPEYRKKKRNRFGELENKEERLNDFFEKFKISSFQQLEDEFSRLQQKERKLKTFCERLGVTEEYLEAEFSRFQQTEMKFKTLCEQLGVAQEDLEAPEFRILRQTEIKRNALCEKSRVALEGLEMPTDDFISMDDFSCFNNETMPTDDFIRMDDLSSFSTETMPMDDFIGMDDLTSFSAETFGSLFDGQPPTLGVEEVIMNEFPDQHKHQLEDYNDQTKFSSSKNYSLNKL